VDAVVAAVAVAVAAFTFRMTLMVVLGCCRVGSAVVRAFPPGTRIVIRFKSVELQLLIAVPRAPSGRSELRT
jgi:hypothetical protein